MTPQTTTRTPYISETPLDSEIGIHQPDKVEPEMEFPDEEHGVVVGSSSKAHSQRGVVGYMKRGMDILVEHGVEERGIEPRPENVGPLLSPVYGHGLGRTDGLSSFLRNETS